MLEIMNTDKLALRPNCLLTRYPLVFINGVRSLFFYQQLAFELQDYVAEHGYMVLRPSLSFRDKTLRKQQLQNWLKQQKHEHFHFIMSSHTRNEFAVPLETYPNSSLTLTSDFMNMSATSEIPIPLSYRLHQLFCSLMGAKTESYSELLNSPGPLLRERFLVHCVELAENVAI